jgi:ABC transporter substrate binding protein (PQQ-dependent alcohol dehydrogenase system)
MNKKMLCASIALTALLSASVMAWAGSSVLEDPQRPPPRAEQPQPAAVLKTEIVYLGKKYNEPPPLSLVDVVATDKGIQGARIALDENNKTGRLLGQEFKLTESIVGEREDVVAAARGIFAAGHRLIVADLEAADLVAVADLASQQASDAILINARASDDELRMENCRSNVFHVPPSYAMRTDALAQYLIWKKWRRWFLISGKGTDDLKYAAAIKRSAVKFGGKIVAERTYTFDAGNRRTDSGHQQIQTQMPMLTQGAPEHDVVFVADISEAFGDYLQYRTAEPKPVVGTHGLMGVAWHRSFEQYAAMQMQNRFERLVKRAMTERDYTAWLAVRIFGEAVVRISKNTAPEVRAFITSKDFEVAGFKGQGMTFRKWDNQMRQPILISGPRALVSISPQDGFLHQHFKTDTLGFDEPESKCRFEKLAANPG